MGIVRKKCWSIRPKPTRDGVDTGAVEGIIKVQAITAVPQASPFVVGVTNLNVMEK